MKRSLCCLEGERSDLFPSSPSLSPNCAESFPWQAIVDGTLNFNETQNLGQGNFGDVYRCEFPSDSKVGAAKIQREKKQTAHLEFLAEVTTLHKADHPNVIKLLGICYEPNHRAIVYELMPNGSLDHYLTANQKTQLLDWETRMKIAVGVAKGLVYLHMKLKSIHQDVKADNILLDQHFDPKLADFGLATKIVEGEDGIEQEFGTCSDVYSYGNLLVQLFTGRNLDDSSLSLEEDKDIKVDVALGNQFSVEGFKKVLDIWRMCVRTDALSRPNMDVVEKMILDAADYTIAEASTATSSYSRPWTQEEDEILKSYVQHHGRQSWNYVVEITKLSRSKESCRLRWNYNLRPDLGKGKRS